MNHESSENIKINLEDAYKVSGHVIVEKNGVVVFEGKNLVVDNGRAWLADMLIGASSAVSHIAVGTGTFTSDAARTELVSQIGTRVARSSATTPEGTASVQYTGQLDDTQLTTAPSTITEAGLFNTATGASLIAHLALGPISRSGTDLVTITWAINITATS